MVAVLAWASREGASPIIATRRTPPFFGTPAAGPWPWAGVTASAVAAAAHTRTLASRGGRARPPAGPGRAWTGLVGRPGAKSASGVGSLLDVSVTHRAMVPPAR